MLLNFINIHKYEAALRGFEWKFRSFLLEYYISS